MRLLPLLCGEYFLLVGVGLRMAVHRLRHGNVGLKLLHTRRPRQLARDGAVLLLCGYFSIMAAATATAPEWLPRLGASGAGEWASLRIAGAAVVVIFTSLMALAQSGLGAAWRIGIDEGSRAGMVRTGLYSLCRNPIFVCLGLVIIGFAMVMPGWAAAAAAVIGLVAIRWQVAAEEVYLLRRYGDEYRAYAASVGRFTPWTGRLRVGG